MENNRLTMKLPEVCEAYRANVISTSYDTVADGIIRHEFSKWAIPLYTKSGEFKPLISRNGFEVWFKEFFIVQEVKGI